ncbi:sensor histidine kinase [Pseudodesulfovibrio pelocollis]|uniref:sensor histidine kinase n=1 Tax=Pseudodesulfovibrio pelocollis TaxID=3051432 RepID=UPI00255A8F68|nr:PAS domain-containing sensor histidine kinase [Pseudodesulfovibrio sp. SB368]
MNPPSVSFGPVRWAVFVAVAGTVLAVWLYTNQTLRSVEGALPTILLAQIEDLSRITDSLGGLVADAAMTRLAPSPAAVARLAEGIDRAYADLVALRDTYVFDNLVQASVFHATVAPALVDAGQWLTHGVSGHAPDSALTLTVVHSRLRDTLVKASAERYASHDMARAILQDQRARLERFIRGVNMLLLVTVLVALLTLALMLRQQKLLRREAKVRKERESLIAILESTSDLVSTATPDERLTYLNGAGRRMLGWDADEPLADKRIPDLHPAWTLRVIRDEGLPAAAAQGSWEGETALLRRDGREIPVSQVILAHNAAAGEPEFFSAIMRDITERKRADEALKAAHADLERQVAERTRDLEAKAAELESANRELVALDTLKSSLVSTVSHELRTPLTSMLGFSKLVRRDFLRHYRPLEDGDRQLAEKGERIEANLNIIAEETDRLARLISDMLDLARIESGRMDWADRPTDVAECVRAALGSMRGVFSEDSPVSLDHHIEPGLPTVMADPDRITQVVVNLLANAHKFTPKGQISVRVWAEGRGRDQAVCLSVEDTGCGIPGDDRERIFEKFYQADACGLTDRPPGTGLGLTICGQIVEHYGGRIDVESMPGRGSRFVVRFPAMEGSA